MISSAEFKIICRMIKELESRFDTKLDGFGKKFIGLLQGYAIIDPSRQTMTSREICEQYGISDRKLCMMRKKRRNPFHEARRSQEQQNHIPYCRCGRGICRKGRLNKIRTHFHS